MDSTAYKGRKTNIMNFLSRRIHFRFFHSTFCTFNSLFTSKPRIPICRFTEMSKGLIAECENRHKVAILEAPFFPKLSLVFIAPTHGGMASLDEYRDDTSFFIFVYIFCLFVAVLGEFDPLNVAAYRSDSQKARPCFSTSVLSHSASKSNHGSLQ